MPATAANIDAYIAAQPSAVRPIRQQIRAIVRKVAPDAQEAISYRIPAFLQGGVLLYVAALKKHIGVYPPVHGDAALLKALAPYRGERATCHFRWRKRYPTRWSVGSPGGG